MLEFDLSGKDSESPDTKLQTTCPQCKGTKYETGTSASGFYRKCLDCNYIPAVGGLPSMILMDEREKQELHNLLVDARDNSEFDDIGY
jgi:hypothetical protein